MKGWAQMGVIPSRELRGIFRHEGVRGSGSAVEKAA
jgi:hypothetical protein